MHSSFPCARFRLLHGLMSRAEDCVESRHARKRRPDDETDANDTVGVLWQKRMITSMLLND